MDRALTEDPPPSVSEVARRLHFARGERLYQIDRARVRDAGGKASRGYPSVTAKASRAPRKCERPQMKRILEDSLARECPVSVSEIAAQNGYANAGCIRLEFPDLCRAIGRKIAQLKKAEMNGKGRDPESCAGRRSAAHGGANGQKVGFRVSWSSAAKLSCAYTRRFLRKERPTRRPKESSYVLT